MRIVSMPWVVAILAVASRAASAEGEARADAFTDRPIAIVLIAGVTTPVGLGGAALEATPARWLTIGAGGGMSVAGAQVALMPRVRFYTGERHGWSIGAGVSHGKYSGCPPCGGPPGDPDEQHPARWTWWANLDAGFEGRAISTGFTYRIFAGVARPFGGCLGAYGEQCAAAGLLPMLGIALGSML